ncbi:hypothetical protein ADUPG1_010136, partial [Aduncisulcus paluster]
DGYTGDACSTRVTGCPFVTVGDESVVCGAHGECDEEAGACSCSTGWSGSTCETQECSDSMCSSSSSAGSDGACYAVSGDDSMSWTCTCADDEVILTTDGTMIQSCVSACNATLGCGTGTCTDTSTDDDVSSWECLCPTDSYLSGSNTCISAGGVDDGCYECSSLHGQCTLDSNTMVPACVCELGFSGFSCDIVDLDTFCPYDSDGVSCGSEGTCVEAECVCSSTSYLDDTGLCVIPSGDFFGVCDECSDQHGQCSIITNTYTQEKYPVCVCEEGWSGDTCENDVCLLSEVECSGHGECVLDGWKEWMCLCQDGYYGEACTDKKRSISPVFYGFICLLSVIAIVEGVTLARLSNTLKHESILLVKQRRDSVRAMSVSGAVILVEGADMEFISGETPDGTSNPSKQKKKKRRVVRKKVRAKQALPSMEPASRGISGNQQADSDVVQVVIDPISSSPQIPGTKSSFEKGINAASPKHSSESFDHGPSLTPSSSYISGIEPSHFPFDDVADAAMLPTISQTSSHSPSQKSTKKVHELSGDASLSLKVPDSASGDVKRVVKRKRVKVKKSHRHSNIESVSKQKPHTHKHSK